MFGRRPDASLVRDLSAGRRFMPFISPRRNESVVYFAQDVAVDAALAFVERHNTGCEPAHRVTLFHLLLRAIARTLDERPGLNRFTAGGRIWQRDGVWITFSAKQSFEDGAPVIAVKKRIDPEHSLDEMVKDISGGLRKGRQGERSSADREVDLLLKLPATLVRLAFAAVGWLDGLGLMPRSMIASDPMYCSAFVANLGSVGLEAGYHHLWEHGNCPLFCVIGRIKPGPEGRRVATLKWTFDERVEDGLYCARSLERMRELIENPEKL